MSVLDNTAGLTAAPVNIVYSVADPAQGIMFAFRAPADAGCTPYLASASMLLTASTTTASVALLATVHPTTYHSSAHVSPMVGNADGGWVVRASQAFFLSGPSYLLAAYR